jgi:membrane protein
MNECLEAESASVAAREVVHHLRRFVNMRWVEVISLFREAVSGWTEDNAPRLGASLAYYATLSIAPMLLVAVAIAAVVFSKPAVEGQLFGHMQSVVGREGAVVVQELIRNADRSGAGPFATISGIAILLFAASSVVLELEEALNTIWHIQSPGSSGTWSAVMHLLKARIVSFAIVLGTGLLLLLSLLVNTVISVLGNFFSSLLPFPASALRVAEFILAFSVTTMLFAVIYKFIPAVHLRWSDVFIGACVTSLLFTLGKQLIALYLGSKSFASSYGAAGSLVALLVWVYYSSQLFFLGAEFTKVYTRRYGSLRACSVN